NATQMLHMRHSRSRSGMSEIYIDDTGLPLIDVDCNPPIPSFRSNCCLLRGNIGGNTVGTLMG
ncbi:MAG: hypothetical protein J2P36_09790, partial [Ktedonobacteraceae bacterium]|nr:hypothetical protein [Ktedonobacteraceae bacterium]